MWIYQLYLVMWCWLCFMYCIGGLRSNNKIIGAQVSTKFIKRRITQEGGWAVQLKTLPSVCTCLSVPLLSVCAVVCLSVCHYQLTEQHHAGAVLGTRDLSVLQTHLPETGLWGQGFHWNSNMIWEGRAIIHATTFFIQQTHYRVCICCDLPSLTRRAHRNAAL